MRLHDDHLESTRPASKTDPFEQDVSLTMAATDNVAFAVATLEHFIPDRPASLSAALFRVNGAFARERVTTILAKQSSQWASRVTTPGEGLLQRLELLVSARMRSRYWGNGSHRAHWSVVVMM